MPPQADLKCKNWTQQIETKVMRIPPADPGYVTVPNFELVLIVISTV